jgi:hypothetical protein
LYLAGLFPSLIGIRNFICFWIKDRERRLAAIW